MYIVLRCYQYSWLMVGQHINVYRMISWRERKNHVATVYYPLIPGYFELISKANWISPQETESICQVKHWLCMSPHPANASRTHHVRICLAVSICTASCGTPPAWFCRLMVRVCVGNSRPWSHHRCAVKFMVLVTGLNDRTLYLFCHRLDSLHLLTP